MFGKKKERKKKRTLTISHFVTSSFQGKSSGSVTILGIQNKKLLCYTQFPAELPFYLKKKMAWPSSAGKFVSTIRAIPCIWGQVYPSLLGKHTKHLVKSQPEDSLMHMLLL